MSDPFEYAPDEEPGDDARALYADAAADQAALEAELWTCEDCGWRWPLASAPWQDSECDACGGEMSRG